MDLWDLIIHHLSNHSGNERAKGNHSKANGLACIAFGIFLLPIPIIGLPLIGYGLYKIFS